MPGKHASHVLDAEVPLKHRLAKVTQRGGESGDHAEYHPGVAPVRVVIDHRVSCPRVLGFCVVLRAVRTADMAGIGDQWCPPTDQRRGHRRGRPGREQVERAGPWAQCATRQGPVHVAYRRHLWPRQSPQQRPQILRPKLNDASRTGYCSFRAQYVARFPDVPTPRLAGQVR